MLQEQPAPVCAEPSTTLIRFILTRLSLVIPTFLGMTLLVFFLIRLVPGDPIETLAGERGIDPVRHAALLKEYGLDRPILVQYGIYIGRVLHGDLGKSIVTRARRSWKSSWRCFPPPSNWACAILFALLLGIPAGILAAVKRNSIFDHGVMGISLSGYSMPIFWWGLLLILLFSVQLDLTPVSGRLDVKYFIEPVTGFLLIDAWMSGEKGAFKSAVSHLILPMVVLGTQPLAVIARMTRSAMLEVLGEDYIRTARAKGLSTCGWSRCTPAQRADPGGHRDRPADRRAVHRCAADRDHLLLARCRQMADRGDQPARLPGAAGRRAAGGRHGHGGEPAGRHHLRHHQSPHPAPAMSSPTLTDTGGSSRRPCARCASSGPTSAPTMARWRAWPSCAGVADGPFRAAAGALCTRSHQQRRIS
jgi:dipeptide transport system permease protein